MNRVTLTGRLTRDPELRALPGGKTVCELRIAVDNAARGYATGYFDVCSYGAGGEAAARVLSEGWLVGVEGRLEHREWPHGDVKRSAVSINGDVEFLAAPRNRNEDDIYDEE